MRSSKIYSCLQGTVRHWQLITTLLFLGFVSTLNLPAWAAPILVPVQQTAPVPSGFSLYEPWMLQQGTIPPATEPCSCEANRLSCRDFETEPEAQACFDYCVAIGQEDIHQLDKNENDIACDSLPDAVLVGAGDIGVCNEMTDSKTAKLLDDIGGTVFTLGDNVYSSGTTKQFTNCYEPTWGRHKERTRPVPGNHDYQTSGAAGYYTYFGSAASPLDNDCTSDCKGYYSYDLGAWHIIALNSEIDVSEGSAQEKWLRADLAAHNNVCTLAYWHEPLFSSGEHGNSRGKKALWNALYEFGADVVLNGHDHDYERFAPQNPDGKADAKRGIRQFIVGTGGVDLRPFATLKPNSEVRNSSTWGVLKLSLEPTSYEWEFVPIAGQSFQDSGSADCVDIDVSSTPTHTPTPTKTPKPVPTKTLTPTPTP